MRLWRGALMPVLRCACLFTENFTIVTLVIMLLGVYLALFYFTVW